MNNPITQSTDETCNIVQDLLPLYYDDVCSPSSKRLVEKHLKTCEKCQNTYNELKNDSIDSMIKKEADSVLKQHEKKEKTAAYKTGVIIAGLLLIPILITFIVCLSNGDGLNTFAVVTASMLLVAAMTVVPLMAQQKKLTKCIICGVFALLLIFFFVDRMYSSNEFMLHKLILTEVIPAYQELADSLESLRGTGKSSRGLAFFEGGREYYLYPSLSTFTSRPRD